MKTVRMPVFRKRRSLRLFPPLGMALALLLLPRVVAARDFIPNLIAKGAPRNIPSSPVQFTYVFGFNYPTASQRPVECAFFVNNDRRTAIRVKVVFHYTNASGVDIGQDTLTVNGKFATGIPIEEWPPGNGNVQTGPQCQYFDDGLVHRDNIILYMPKTASITLSASASEVDFQDGTAWKAAGSQ